MDCPIFRKCVKHACKKEQFEKTCKIFNDCQKNHMCFMGKCIVNKCLNSLYCPPNSYCENGKCKQVTYKKCWNDLDCVGGDVCANKMCIAKSDDCQSNTDCPSHLKCSDKGTCHNSNSKCSTHMDCKLGELCLQNICSKIDIESIICYVNIQCPKSYLCIGNKCQLEKDRGHRKQNCIQDHCKLPCSSK